ncbi:hypothetical protein LUZ63_008551 [Rhynchospora breviuscula]|uniref:Aminotransferase-like plant mobile domain-containing protein n=1 Tax=Rhynchospora breviuscula TaxID=2022672 RepID=A0A9Q0CV08_9POAL|nr:hypothetical protein LUZ63_008551 [Rhynchospora breviuscula]
MPPRRRVPEAPPRRSMRLRGDPGVSTSTASVDAEASTSADPVVPSGPVNADRLLHLDESKVRGTGHWRAVLHRAKMSRTAEVDERLMRLGLIHFVQLGHMQLDHSLLQGLAMFWRPETHTFFFPHVGEMTVTLEDMAFLYGLPTAGRTVTGRTDYDAIQLLQNLALSEDTDTAIVEKCFREKERKKWTTRHKSKKFTGPTRSGIEYARNVCMKMKPEHVVWRPYDHIRDRMPRCAQVEQRMFLLRIPCIHYWVVMWHHVNRVMHQFMLYQTVPPPPREPWSRMEELMGYQHNTYRGIDWHQLFVHEVNKWANTNEARVIEDRPWSEDIWSDYRRWLSVHGGAHLVQISEGAASGPAHNLSYLRETPGHINLHSLREALRGCAWVVKKGFRRAGKQLMRGCSTSLDIVGEPARLPRLLESKGLHSDIDFIPDTDDEDDAPEPGSIEEQFFMRV